MLTATEVLNKEFLEVRCQLIEIAASLDRIDRAATAGNESFADDSLERIYDSLRLLANPRQGGRSEALDRKSVV